ncbi:MAG: hypothetical protein WBG32_05110 [Nodosilinea sp.]
MRRPLVPLRDRDIPLQQRDRPLQSHDVSLHDRDVPLQRPRVAQEQRPHPIHPKAFLS